MSHLESQPDFSVVITCFNEERSIDEFSSRLFGSLRAVDATFEVVFVDDGSRDGTLDRLRSIFNREPAVASVLSLFRNSGQAAAITAGMAAARGRALVLIDSDLQLDPEELPRLIAEYRAGSDIVSGYRIRRKDSLARRTYSFLANAMMRMTLGARFRDFGCTFKVIDGRLLRAFDFGPRKVLRLVDVAAAAGRCGEVPVTHHARRYGRSGWRFSSLFDLHTTNVIAVMKRPFQYAAAAAAVAGVLLFVRIALDVFFPIRLLPTVTNGLLLNIIIGALLVTVAIQSLIGELVIRSHEVLRSVPAYIVKDMLMRDQAAEVVLSEEAVRARC